MKRLISRRRALQSISACACTACLAAAGVLQAAEKGAGAAPAGHGGAANWGYEGAGAPQHWGELSPDFKVCSLGMEQTPIDLTEAIKAQVDSPFTLDYRAVGGKIVNDGHTIMVNTDPGCSATIKGVRYELLQYHFHHPSEHLLSGKPFDMEAHYVHRTPDGRVAVIGSFIRVGAESAPLASMFSSMPATAGSERAFAPVDPSLAFPVNRAYYRYMGSMTTPPCLEGLVWTMFKDPIEASASQIQQFAALFPLNARPVQNTNRRFLLDVGS